MCYTLHSNTYISFIYPYLSLSSLLFWIPITVSEKEFLHFFEQFGPIIDSVIMLDRVTKRSRGFGFVTFAHEVSLSSSYVSMSHLVNNYCLSIFLISHISQQFPDSTLYRRMPTNYSRLFQVNLDMS